MEITPARVLATTSTAGLGGFMQRFPASLDTLVGEEGRQLSAGERYVVGLLRALVLNPRVLVVDEAFAVEDGAIVHVRSVGRERPSYDERRTLIATG
jgi:ATP-binding cassette subfamily B protein